MNGDTSNDNANSDPILLVKKLEEKIDMSNIDSNSTSVDLMDVIPIPSPPLSYPKYLTMQERRVIVTVRYTNGCGLKPYFLTVAKKIKQSYPDVMIERILLYGGGGSKNLKKNDYYINDDDTVFEVCVDTKVIVGRSSRRNTRKKKSKSSFVLGGYDTISSSNRRRSIYVSMKEIDLAIARARRKRRPNSTLYNYNNNNLVIATSATSTSS